MDYQRYCNETAVEGFMLTETQVNDIVVVTDSGDVDMVTAPEVLKAIQLVGRRRSAALIVNLADVSFLSLAGMNVLIDARRRVLPHRRFGVVADGAATIRPLELLGIDAVIALYSTLGEALIDFA